MASHYKFYSGVGETVPFNRRYGYPSQAHKTLKSTVKFPPKNGAVFSDAGSKLIRFEFPSQGYLNPLNTFFEFDLLLGSSTYGAVDASGSVLDVNIRLQNSAHCLVNRLRILYGSLVIEDINDYNIIMRLLSEHAATNTSLTFDQTTINEGLGGSTAGSPNSLNVRSNFIQGQAAGNSLTATTGTLNPRRYMLNLGAGLFTQDKLIPLKWMASQLAIEIYLEAPASCLVYETFSAGVHYSMASLNMVTEILEFDSSYDAAFLDGLKKDGVPLKLGSWHTFTFSSASSQSYNLQIQERSRSVKAAFMVQLPVQTSVSGQDTHSFLSTTGASPFSSYPKNSQWRIGGRFFPSQQVTGDTTSGSTWNGGCEFYSELQKALNQVADYRLSTGTNATRWGIYSVNDWPHSLAAASLVNSQVATACVGYGPQNFVIAGDFETSDGTEISGLNAEEQSDIALIVNYSAPQGASNPIKVFTFFDELLVIRDNNQVEVIL